MLSKEHVMSLWGVEFRVGLGAYVPESACLIIDVWQCMSTLSAPVCAWESLHSEVLITNLNKKLILWLWVRKELDSLLSLHVLTEWLGMTCGERGNIRPACGESRWQCQHLYHAEQHSDLPLAPPPFLPFSSSLLPPSISLCSHASVWLHLHHLLKKGHLWASV